MQIKDHEAIRQIFFLGCPRKILIGYEKTDAQYEQAFHTKTMEAECEFVADTSTWD